MYLQVFLIVLPLAAGAVLLVLKNDPLRGRIVRISAFLICAGSIALFIANSGHEKAFFVARSLFTDKTMFAIEVLLAAYIFYAGIKYKRPLTSILIIAQITIMAVFEVFFRRGIVVEHNLFIDRLSLLMTLVIGIVGGMVAVYAIGYMRDFHKSYHGELADNTGFFFFVIFGFLFAMFGIVYSNNLLWLYFFWELTTIASFLLIGYKRTREARRSSFWALELNLIAGLAFAITIVYLYFNGRVMELDRIMALGKTAALVPVALLCFSGLVKCAQFPFASWLIGAMAGPTPASALLHSSTMVKAGVYIMLRFSLVLQGTMVGFMLGIIGGVTFLLGSLIAVSESDSKKVLAYSTVANLGLIVLCAGVATHEAVWAALLLIIFHALAKSLLFICVGTVDNQIHSTEIEDMSGLVIRMPKVSVMLEIGMAGMFLAPFGMLISKWAALKALVDYNPILAAFVVFGGSAMVFFWVKWMGTLITVTRPYENIEHAINVNERVPLFILSALVVGACLFFPLVCGKIVEPFLLEYYGRTVELGDDNIAIMTIMMAMVMLFPLAFTNYGKRVKVISAYLGGANTGDGAQFRGSGGAAMAIDMKNYYLKRYFGEETLARFGVIIAIFLVAAMLGVSVT